MSRARKLKIEEMGRLEREEYLAASSRRVSIILDNIRSMHNVGAIFRTADAFRLEHIALCGITGFPPHPEIHKSALGAEEVVPWVRFSDTQEAVDILLQKGYQVWALEQAEGSVPLQDLHQHLIPDKPFGLVVGNEVDGVQQSVMDRCHGAIEIPQFGTKHSLNVSVAAGMAIWTLAQLYDFEENV